MSTPKKPFVWKEIPQREKLYVGIIAALVIACGVLTWKVFDSSTTVQQISLYNENLEQDKDALNKELDEMLAQYENLETDNKGLQEDILKQKEQIEKMKDELDKNKGNVQLIRKYQKEVTTLRTIIKGYVVTIGSLNTLNQDLRYENTNIKEKLTDSQKQYERLNSEAKDLQGIVRKASKLNTYNLTFEGIRLRNSGKQTETSRSDRIELLKVCFTLEENVTTKPGKKNIYVQIFNPNGEVVLNQSNPEDKSAPESFSSVREITYENQRMDVCVYTNLNGQELIEGEYAVKIFEAGDLIGTVNTTFK